MVIRHEPINATAFLNHHPFVREKLDYLHNLVVIKFRSCQFIGNGQLDVYKRQMFESDAILNIDLLDYFASHNVLSEKFEHVMLRLECRCV